MKNNILDYIDSIYEIIFKHDYNYKNSLSDLIHLKKQVDKDNFEENAYYYQFMATIEYFIHLSHTENNIPYQNVLPKNDQINIYFNKSFNLDKDNPPLRYLYALYLYNTKDFINAEKEFFKINIKYFIDLDFEDRVLKIQELILCCKIFLNKINENDIIRFLRRLSLEKDFYPADLIMTLKYNVNYYTDEIKIQINKFK